MSAEELPEIRGTPPSDPDREETDSGFAQNDRVHHAKRGPGVVTGFFGEYVQVQFDSEPHGQHKYNHKKARSALCFPDAAGEYTPPPAAAAGKPKKSKLKKKDRVEHATRGAGTIASVDASGEVTVKFDSGDAMEYDMADALEKLKLTGTEEEAATGAAAPAAPAGNGIRGTVPDRPDREETDSGFAQGDRIKHDSRGDGTVTGFFGEFVVVHFDSEKDEEFQYNHDDARKKLSFI